MPRQHKSELVLTAKEKTRATIKNAEKNWSQLDGVIGKLGVGLGAVGEASPEQGVDADGDPVAA